MNKPLVSPLDRNSTKQAKEMATFYDETLGFTPNSLFTMMHRSRIAKAFLEMNQAVMENKGFCFKFNEKRDCLFVKYDNRMPIL